MTRDDHDPPLLTAGLIATGVVAVSFSGPIGASCLAPALAIATGTVRVPPG
ncbi:MAG: hypothetical protein ABIV05_04615 [Actinomycetota bacterium]